MDQDFTDVNHEGSKMLTLNQFASFMQVCPNTVRGWMNSGELREDRHFIRKKRVIRFHPLGPQLVTIIMEDSAEEKKKRRKLTSTKKGNRRPRL